MMNCRMVQRVVKTAMIIAMVVVGPVLGWPRDGGAHDGKSVFIQHFDQNGDGLVSADEFPGGPNQFRQLDINEDGYLDDAEAPGPPNRMRPDPEELLVELDTDGDEQLTLEEFAGPQYHFERLDIDGNGLLSLEELRAGPLGSPRAGGFENDDIDQDGQVSRAEFSGPEDLFNCLGADGNGYIFQQEVRVSDRPGCSHGESEIQFER